MAERGNGRYKPCSFYVPEKDTELMRFMAAQSNMSLSMRLLMKAFIASNRHQTDIDVSVLDLYDLIRSMRVDPELFDDVPKRRRVPRSISAIEAEELRAREMADQSSASGGPVYETAERSVPGFSQEGATLNPGGMSYTPPPPAPEQVYRNDSAVQTVSHPASAAVESPAVQSVQPMGQPSVQPASAPAPAPAPVSEPAVQSVVSSPEPAPAPAPVSAQPPASEQPPAQTSQPAVEEPAVGAEELDPMSMMGGE